ncbi:hypothetical protein QFZ69_004634 [Arthrobacter sp. V1I7]|uniref:hypothetical protein n=1 Tax=Arthrobacter sp. V1I7 TaxID=3042274 RepID=UPI002788106F|nr:hypothetical protein [Arthrobacter sp. V1I7]MDQ0823688.1 hypothetical protein [Arthrobacter sp. V1I7]
MKQRFRIDVVKVAQVLAEKAEEVDHATGRTTVALNSIVDNAKIIYGVVSPLFLRFRAK